MRKKTVMILAAAAALLVTGCKVTVTPKTAAAADGSGRMVTNTGISDYPNKAIHMIIPYGAGGTTDVYGRMLAALLEKELGQPVTVMNQGGASGSIGCQYVRSQASDGYTLLVCAETMGTYRTMGISDLGYDDFRIIAPLVGDPKVVVVGKDSQYNTLEELLEAIRENPGKISMSHSGAGGSGHNQGLVLKSLGYETAMTGYDSGNAALLGVIGGQVDFTNPNISTVQNYIESGEVKPLAVFSSERMDAYPGIPAFTEIVPEAEKYLDIPYTALTFCVNNDTPEEVVRILKDSAGKVFESAEWTEFAEGNAAEKLYEKYTTEEEIKDFYDRCQSVICWLQFDHEVSPNSPAAFGIERITE